METEVTWHHTWLGNQQNAWHHRSNMLHLTAQCHNTATTDKPVFLLSRSGMILSPLILKLLTVLAPNDR